MVILVITNLKQKWVIFCPAKEVLVLYYNKIWVQWVGRIHDLLLFIWKGKENSYHGMEWQKITIIMGRVVYGLSLCCL